MKNFEDDFIPYALLRNFKLPDILDFADHFQNLLSLEDNLKNFYEFSGIYLDQWEEIKCKCGNTPHCEGFYPCDPTGKQQEPIDEWNDLYICDRCQIIIDINQLEVKENETEIHC